MAIKVRCRNRNCPMFNTECTFPDSLRMAPGEKIHCGGCGHEPRWIGGERPVRDLPWSDGMNLVQPFIDMDDADA